MVSIPWYTRPSPCQLYNKSSFGLLAVESHPLLLTLYQVTVHTTLKDRKRNDLASYLNQQVVLLPGGKCSKNEVAATAGLFPSSGLLVPWTNHTLLVTVQDIQCHGLLPSPLLGPVFLWLALS